MAEKCQRASSSSLLLFPFFFPFPSSILPNFFQRGTKPRIRLTFHSIPAEPDSTRLFLSLSVWREVRVLRTLGFPTLLPSVVLWIIKGGERRCNYLFQRNLRDFCRGLLLVIGKMGLIMDDSERNVSYMSLSRACGFTLSKNFLLVYHIIILFRQFLYEATKLFSMRF